MIQSETFCCRVCERMVTIQTDDPVHYTNWNLSGRRTVPVCSEECKNIVIDEEKLDQRKAEVKLKRVEGLRREALKNILGLFEVSNYPLPMYEIPDEGKEVTRIVWEIERYLDDLKG